MERIYLDNNATTPVDPGVFAAMRPYLEHACGNPSSSHALGREAAWAVARARRQVADLLACEPDEVVFTSGGTESDNAALFSAHFSPLCPRPGKRRIVTTRVEHPAVHDLCRRMAEQGCDVVFLDVDERGLPDLDAYTRALTPDTALVSVMWANNETGVLLPVAEMAARARDRGILFHTDAVQAVGKVPVDLSAAPVDLLSLSAHKFHGPKGVGALFVRRSCPFHPHFLGGGQEQGRRPGTENVPGIVGLGAACEIAGQRMAANMERVRSLRDRLERGLIADIPGARVHGKEAPRLPNTANISFADVPARDLVRRLDEQGLCVSSGAACHAGSPEPSRVLAAMRVPAPLALSAVRFSLSRLTTAEEVDAAILHVTRAVDQAMTRTRGT